jgi:hypothetical protein
MVGYERKGLFLMFSQQLHSQTNLMNNTNTERKHKTSSFFNFITTICQTMQITNRTEFGTSVYDRKVSVNEIA